MNLFITKFGVFYAFVHKKRAKVLIFLQISKFYFAISQIFTTFAPVMNTFGEYFTFTSFGESHGRAIGGVLDGVPAGLQIDMQMIRHALDRRAGRTEMDSERLTLKGAVSSRALRERDEVEWLSGVLDGVTLGTPIAFIIRNQDQRSEDYEWLRHSFRIGHADRTYQAKYGIRDHRGGGRASARETASRVVAGSVAMQLLAQKNIYIHAELIQVGTENDPAKFQAYIEEIRQSGDSVGGIIECTITGAPVGVGEPIFDKLQSHLAFAMMSINACKGFEYGSGFRYADKLGTEMYLSDDLMLISGGIAGGISDGTPIVFRCVFKPTATNSHTLAQLSAANTHSSVPNYQHPTGRHDACVAIRAVPVVEAMAALVLIDLLQ